MVIRNRLFALIYRVFALIVASFCVWVIFSLRGLEAWSLFSTHMAVFVFAIFVFDVVFNAIDLRNGFAGIAASMWMPLSLAAVYYAAITSLVFACVIFPTSGLGATYSELWQNLLIYLFVPFLMIGDWLLFEEKGTVKWPTALYVLPYPLFFFALTMLRHLLWDSIDYPYDFIDPATYKAMGGFWSGNSGWSGVWFVFAFSLLGSAACAFILIFINNLLAGKFRSRGTKIVR